MTDLSIRIKRLHQDAVIPSYAKPGDAGMDLYAMDNVDLWPGDIRIVPCGFAIEIPPGYEGQVRPRSGLACKSGVTVVNTPGTIDSGYRGEVKVGLVNLGSDVAKLPAFTRIAQLVICPVVTAHITVVDELSDSTRGAGGFGSTGK